METFTGIRSDRAPESFSWQVSLPGDEVLRKAADGTVQVVDPSIDVNSAGTKPDPQPAGSRTLDALKAAGAVSSDVIPADPGLDPSTPVANAGVAQKPLDPEQSAGTALPDPKTGPPADANSPKQDPPPELAQAAERLDAKAKADTASAIQTAGSDDPAAQTSKDVAERLASEGPQPSREGVVATVSAPRASDANGDAVAVTLSVHGDTITMNVPHDAETAYPVAADPYVLVSEAHWEWRCCTPVWHPWQVQVGTRWSFDYIGHWFGASIWWVPASQRFYAGNGLWGVWYGWGWGFVYNIPWSPVYTWVSHPVMSNVWDDWYAAFVGDQYAWDPNAIRDPEDGAWNDDGETLAQAASAGPGAGTPNQIQLHFRPTGPNEVHVRQYPSDSAPVSQAFNHHNQTVTAPTYHKGDRVLVMADLGGWVVVSAPVPGNQTYYARGYVRQNDLDTNDPGWQHRHTWSNDYDKPSQSTARAVSGGYTSVRNTPQGWTIGYLFEGSHFFDETGPKGAKQYLRGWAGPNIHVNGVAPYCKFPGGGICHPYVP